MTKENNISTLNDSTNTGQLSKLGEIQTKTHQKFTKKFKVRTRKRIVRYGILSANILILALVTGFILKSPSSGPNAGGLSIQSVNNSAADNALDELSSADIAVNVARITNLPESLSVVNRADTVNAQLAVIPADDTVVAKPQVVTTELKSYKDIVVYKAVKGDTVAKIAERFGITSDSIRWSNGIIGDNITVGNDILIPPVNGIVHTVKAGDTVDSLASKYKAKKDQIIADNDIDILGLTAGRNILIRNGDATPAPVARVATASNYGSSYAWGGGGAVYGSNGYDYGYCTWYAANKRAAAGNPIPSNLGNASTWRALAQRAGFAVGNVPRAGAVIWTPPRDYYGHVGYVESVNADGSVNISEMNTAGWGVVSTKTLTAAQAAGYSYIY